MAQHETALSVTLDLELPEGRVLGAEIDLIEHHLGDLIREILYADASDRQAADNAIEMTE